MILAFQHLFELLEREPVVDATALDDILVLEATLGRRLPAALREWFSFTPACRKGCRLGSLSELVKWTMAINKGPLEDRLYLGIHDGDVYYYVRWDDGDDPTVRLEDMTFGMIDLGYPECGSFSLNVLFWAERDARWDFWARTFGVPCSPAAWEFMSRNFTILGGALEDDARSVVFFEPGATVWIMWDAGDPRRQETAASWILSSRSKDGFLRAAKTIGPLVNWFAASHPECDASKAARELLARGVH